MSCNCDSRLDSILEFLVEIRAEIGAMKKEIGIVKEEVRTVKEEIGVVKTKCIRTEKEILGITAESEVTADALMETTTVRHLVEKLVFDLSVLTVESNDRASSEAKRQEEIATATTELHSKFSEAKDERVKDLKLKYNVVTPKTFQAEFSDFIEEFRSETEKTLTRRGYANCDVYQIVEEITKATDPGDLFERRFMDKNKNMESFIWEQYGEVLEVYAKTAVETKDDFPELALNIITKFLNKFKLCAESYVTFQEELLLEFRQINEQVEANRSLLEGLTEKYRRFSRGGKDKELSKLMRDLYESELKARMIVCNSKLIPLFVEQLRQNMCKITNISGRT